MSTSVADQFTVAAAAGGVTAPKGFAAAGLHCGIKAKAGALDLGMLVADTAVPAAGIFTTNLAQAAPVTVSKRHLEANQGRVRAIVVNSGCANACTGTVGMGDARQMAAETATRLRCAPEQVLVASTGVIGVNLRMDKVLPGIAAAAAALGRDNGGALARAIMTTDPFPKEHAVTVRTAHGTFTVGGTAKGSGMIEPNMATMLGFVATDAKVSSALLQRALRESSAGTFNAITVDGDGSTNDCVFALASGASGVEVDDELYPALLAGFYEVSRELAIGIVRGGEGATKLITIAVKDARTAADAMRVAKTIANSPLVKTAIFGNDPNWGRIAMAAGRSGAHFDARNLRITLGGVQVFYNGEPTDFDLSQAESVLKNDEVVIEVSLGAGEANWTAWTCDFSYDYVKINAEYHT